MRTLQFLQRDITEATKLLEEHGRESDLLRHAAALAANNRKKLPHATQAIIHAMGGSELGFQVLDSEYGIWPLHLREFGAHLKAHIVNMKGELSLSTPEAKGAASQALLRYIESEFELETPSLEERCEALEGQVRDMMATLRRLAQQ